MAACSMAADIGSGARCNHGQLYRGTSNAHMAILAAVADVVPQCFGGNHDHQPGIANGAADCRSERDCRCGDCGPDLDFQCNWTRVLGMGLRLYWPRDDV